MRDSMTDLRLSSLLGSLRETIDDLASWARVERPDLTSLAEPDGSVTIMFSDIEGSTSLNQKLGDDRWMDVLEVHDRAFRHHCQRHRGRIVKSQGDGFMVAFPSARAAVSCAIAIQQDLASHSPGIQVRIGLHRGVALHRGGDIFGLNVALAARVASAARGGEILITDQIRQELPKGETMARVGRRSTIRLQGLDGRHAVSPVHWRSVHQIPQLPAHRPISRYLTKGRHEHRT